MILEIDFRNEFIIDFDIKRIYRFIAAIVHIWALSCGPDLNNSQLEPNLII